MRLTENLDLRTVLIVILAVVAWGSSASEATAKKNSKSEVKKLYIGEWCNTNFNTRGITRIHIKNRVGGFTVHVWGRCSTTECDWGKAKASLDKTDNTVSVTWDHGFCVREQKLLIQQDGTLKLISTVHYTDNGERNDRTHTYHFKKGLKHDWSGAAHDEK